MYHTLHFSQMILIVGREVLYKAQSQVAEASIKILSLTTEKGFVPT